VTSRRIRHRDPDPQTSKKKVGTTAASKSQIKTQPRSQSPDLILSLISICSYFFPSATPDTVVVRADTVAHYHPISPPATPHTVVAKATCHRPTLSSLPRWRRRRLTCPKPTARARERRVSPRRRSRRATRLWARSQVRRCASMLHPCLHGLTPLTTIPSQGVRLLHAHGVRLRPRL
jgi:hypothetical protein